MREGFASSRTFLARAMSAGGQTLDPGFSSLMVGKDRNHRICCVHFALLEGVMARDS
jgi:hypothetical protein